MVYDPSWPRWVQASVADHFKVAADAKSYTSLIEGIDERTTAFINAPEKIEIRINGPFIEEISKGYYQFEVGVNILISSHMGGEQPNAYLGITITGDMAKSASEAIPVKKYGTGVGDDQSLIGCLTLKRGAKESIKVFHFGEIDKESRLRQFAVDANLEMDIMV